MKWTRRVVQGVAVAYPLLLMIAAAALRFVGEAWWVSLVGLYLPRLGFALPLPFLVVALWAFRLRWLLRLQAVSAVVILFPLMGFVVPLPISTNRDQPTMRVLSYNVNSGHDGVEAVLGEIARYSPDVVLLQETGHKEAFVGPLKSRYPTVEVAGEFIMATRYLPSPNTADSIAGANFQREILETPLGRLAIYNVHTVSPRHPLFALRGRAGIKREIALGRASPLESNADLRASQVQTFSVAAARESDPVILAGDSNLPGLSPLFHRFLSSYEDGFSKASWGFGYTFPTHKGGPWMRIDRILAKGPLRFVRFEVGGAFSASDHLCVVGDLQRR